MRRDLLLALCLASAVGCKASRWRRADKDDGVAGTAAQPTRVAAANATVATTSPTGATFDVDERTGRPKSTLVLRLDYFPEPRPGVTNLPTCYAPFASDFDVGLAVCLDKADVTAAVLAKNLDQDCYTDPKSARVPAVEPLVLAGCRKATLLTHAFEPALRVDVEVRDVN